MQNGHNAAPMTTNELGLNSPPGAAASGPEEAVLARYPWAAWAMPQCGFALETTPAQQSLVAKDIPFETALLEHEDGFVAGASTAVGERWEVRRYSVALEHHANRLDKVLIHAAPEFSRSYLQQLIAQGLVLLVDGAGHNQDQVLRKPAHRLRVGDVLALTLRPPEQVQAFLPEPMPLHWVYQDAHLGVLCKPPGLVVHPGAGNWSGTLLNGLLAESPQFAALPRAGIVHRLDKDTSGLMVVARSREAMEGLVRMIAAHEVHREYWALVHGDWLHSDDWTINAAIGRDPYNRLRMAVVEGTAHPGKSAQTQFACVGRSELSAAKLQSLPSQKAKYSLLHCTLFTGRTHQIRVHSSYAKHPIVGDTLYQGSAALGLHRQALHAFRLRFLHPITQQNMSFYAALPADIGQALQHAQIPLPSPTA